MFIYLNVSFFYCHPSQVVSQRCDMSSAATLKNEAKAVVLINLNFERFSGIQSSLVDHVIALEE